MHAQCPPALPFLLALVLAANAPAAVGATHHFGIKVTSELPAGNVPFSPAIDFAGIMAGAGLTGVLDPNSILVINEATGEEVSFARSEDFAYGDSGRLEWVIRDPAHREFAVHFATVDQRPALIPQDYTPPVGVGDLLRYNAGEPRPIAMPYPARLVDLTGDGKPDFAGCWNYPYRPGSPWDGIICYPAIGAPESLLFGDLVRVRYVDNIDSTDFRHCSKIYMTVDFADLNGDGLVDYVYCPSGDDKLYLYLNSGNRDAGGMPIFVAAGWLPRRTDAWNPCRAVDLNGDGLLDFVVGNVWIKNISESSRQWPMQVDNGVVLDIGEQACFYDVDGDGRPDSVCLEEVPGQEGLSNYRVCWRRNVSESPGCAPQFSAPVALEGIHAPYPRCVTPAEVGGRRGLLVTHDHYQTATFFAQISEAAGPPRFAPAGKVQSPSAVISLGDQAWPFLCDWDGDGDLDLVVGGGYGWPRILINHGDPQRMALGESQHIFSGGRPIRLTRNEVLGPPDHWHDMGYPYPALVDWDGDGLPDLILPNETNRIFWYRNIGARTAPEFGRRRQIACDGYPDSPELRALSAKRAADKNSNNGCYPYEEQQPFMWRTGAAFADWNGNGLMDMITHDGHTRKATLFTQYRAPDGTLRLRKDRAVKLPGGRPIDDSVVERKARWTESFRAVDWDGDGLIDLVYSVAGAHGGSKDGGSIYLLRNCGTEAAPEFEPPVTLSCYGKPIRISNHGPHPWVGDLDGDGLPDIVACVEWSVYPFYGHNAVEMAHHPSYEILPLVARQ